MPYSEIERTTSAAQCAWCGCLIDVRSRRVSGPLPLESWLSHGLCLPCLAFQREKIALYRRRRAGPALAARGLPVAQRKITGR